MKPSIVSIMIISLLLAAVPIAAQEAPNVQVTFVSQTPDPAIPGQYVDVRFRVDNLGGEADALTYELEYDYPFSLPPGENATISRGSLDSYQYAADGALLTWRLLVDDAAVQGTQSTVRVRYWETDNPEASVLTQPVEISIEAPQGLLAISDVTLEPEMPAPGSRFTMTLDLENTGPYAINNVQVRTDLASVPVSPFGSSNERIVRQISARSTEQVSFDLFMSPDAELSIVEIPLEISYSDALGRDSVINGTVGVPVSGEVSYMTNLESTELYVPGSSGEVVVSISNTGASPMNYVSLELRDGEGYDVIGSGAVYLGNLESDDFETGQFMIALEEGVEGSVPLDLAMTYRTGYGEQRTETFTVEHPVYTMQRAQELGLVPAGGGGFWGFLLLIALAIGVIVWLRRRRR